MAAADVLVPFATGPARWSPVETQVQLQSKPQPQARTHARTTAPQKKKEQRDGFDPEKHLIFQPPQRLWTMTGIGLPADAGCSDFAVSEPFPLFSREAVMRMREEALSERVMDNCFYSSNLSAGQLRGYADRSVEFSYTRRLRALRLTRSAHAPRYAPFVYDAWKHPATLAAVSRVAGIDLTTQMDFEIGHINLAPKTEVQKGDETRILGGSPIVGWHTDAYPFVCVTMRSDCTAMVGGETALRTGSGEVLKVRGATDGSSFVLDRRPAFLCPLVRPDRYADRPNRAGRCASRPLH